MLTRQCNKCGAPFIKKEDSFSCYSCHTSYEIPGSASHIDNEENFKTIASDFPAQAKSITYERPIPTNQKKSKAVLPVVLVPSMMIFLIRGAYNLRSTSSCQPAQGNPEAEIQEQLYRFLARSNSFPNTIAKRIVRAIDEFNDQTLAITEYLLKNKIFI